MLLVGPPGAGKSMLAQRFASLLPAMTADEALASAAVASLVGRFYPARYGVRPFAAPHHTASAVALVGGGSPPKPGEISLAHHGVLFLDEFPEFSRASLEALREPLETGLIRIARAAHQAEFPAQFQLIAAMNPCPCGFLGHPTKACRDTPDQVSRYQGKLSGPLLDRIDLHINVQAVPPEQLLNTKSGEQRHQGEDSHVIQQRVEAAHQLAMSRQGSANNLLIGELLHTHMQLAHDATAFVQQAATKLQWSARRMHRVMRVARTIADLEHSPQVASVHVAEAVQYQRVLGGGH
jgi:magnesium chelatase family protein